jgi:putative methyltransferase (TIGR04325 family)
VTATSPDMPSKPADFVVWDGLYASYGEAQQASAGAGFGSDAWIERSRRRLDEILAEPEERLLGTSAYLLPVVAAMLRQPGSTLKVLDFGGGPGTGGFTVALAFGKDADFAYHVVENPAVASLGKDYFGEDPRIVFHRSLPQAFPVDIVHVGSCVQYIDDLDGLLEDLSAFKPKCMLFSDVYAGDIASYWTLQSLWGSRVPFHFMREEEFVNTVQRYGLQLRLGVPYIATTLGKTEPLPMENFPAGRRLARAKHYLFMSA